MIEVPPRLAHLQRDHRGFPIPVIVFRDPRDGKAHFSINDETMRDLVLRQDRCGICGRKLHRGRWFVGGPLSAFHERGAYNDPPMHHECAQFALKVCPYLALRKYGGIELGATLQKPTLLLDTTMIDDRPVLFICAMAVGQQLIEGRHIMPKRPWRVIEYWQHGKMLPREDGERLTAEVMAQPVPEPTNRGVFMGGER